LVLDGLAIGIQPGSNVTALEVLEDGSFLFCTDFNTQGVPGSAVEARRNTGLRHADVYRSTGNGTNELFIPGNALGIAAFTSTSVDALALLPDGSVLFSVQPGGSGVAGSAVAASPQSTRAMNIYRSLRNGTNELFRSAADLGLVSGNLDGLVWNATGTLLFSVAPGTQGALGSAVAAAAPATLGADVFRTASDGTNELFREQAALGITSGGVDALASTPTPTSDSQGIAPTVTIVTPSEGQDVIEGDRLEIQVNSSDDVTVASLEISLGGVTIATVAFPGPSQVVRTTVPLGPGPLQVSATATDLGGRTGAATVDVMVIPDPLTTAMGVVVDDNGNPIENAFVVASGGESTTTDAAGQFSIPGLSTIQGDISVTVTATDPNGLPLRGRASAPPVRAGVTDLGTIVASPSLIGIAFGEISPSFDTDTFTFTAEAGEVIMILHDRVANSASGFGSLDPVVVLIDPNGTQIAFDDDGGSDTPPGPFNNSIISRTLTVPGTYTISARGFSSGTGPYQLTLHSSANAASTLTTVENEPFLETASAVVSTVIQGQTTTFMFTGTAGLNVSITADRVSTGVGASGALEGTLDPSVTLVAPDGSIVATNDDSGSDLPPGPGVNAFLGGVTLPADGVYLLRIQGQNATEGPFELTLMTPGQAAPSLAPQ
jgi:hypothetical protein